MSRSKLILASVLIVLIVLWLSHAFHYYFLLRDYASHGYHVKYPMLYIAIESWLLLCLVMITVVLLVAVRLIGKERGGGA